MFTDLNVKFPYNCVKNCCKANDFVTRVDELQNDNFLLQNDTYMYRKNSMLVDNVLPIEGCDTCIRTEPNSLFRTWNEWNKTFTDEEKQRLRYEDSFTNYEFVLSSACDLKCIYCHPKDSSSWAKEMGVPQNKGSEEWKKIVINKVIESLKIKTFDPSNQYTFFFSGGEPTYNTETLDFVTEVLKYVPKKNTRICISTNANTKPKVFKKYIEAIQSDLEVKWAFDCSIDGVEKVCEAIRYGISWKTAIQNIETLLQQPNVLVRISPTVNLYSIPTMYEFISFFLDLFGKYDKIHKYMFNYNMAQESGMSPSNLPIEYKSSLDTSIALLKERNVSYYEHLENIKNVIGTEHTEHKIKKIKTKFEYFKSKRPDMDWDSLFPHIVDIIGKE